MMRRQKGVALMAVLLIFAVLAALAVRMSGNHALLLAQSRHQFEHDLALNYALGAEELAKQALFEDFTKTGVGVDHLEETWAQTIPPFEVDEGGYIEVHVEDLNGCFNLNALSDPATAAATKTQLVNLLRNLSLPESIADLVLDWIDPDQNRLGFGAEHSEYLLHDPPYRAANQRMSHISELRLLEGLDQEQLQALSAYTCVLPSATLQLNVNTASAEALAALDSNIDFAALSGTLSAAPRLYDNVTDFVNDHPSMNTRTASSFMNLLGVQSRLFRINVQAQVGDSMVQLSSLARRSDTGQVAVLQRDFGRDFRSRIVLTSTESGAASTGSFAAPQGN